MSWLLDKILELFWYLLYLIDITICWLLQAFYKMFNIFAGVDQVKVNGKDRYLINVFFNNSTITVIFYGMLLIGFVLLFGFTIAAVIRKSFDLGDRIQQPMSEILRKALNSFIFMLCMNFIISGTIYATNSLMTSITYLFDNANAIGETLKNTIEFTETDYAIMADIFDTIGSYAINPSSTSRYNVNSCFNSIRAELQTLSSLHPNFYSFTYLEKNEDGVTTESWQSILAQIARSHDLTTDQPLDEYDNSLSAAMENAMKYVTVNTDNMTVLESYRVSNSMKAVASDRLDVMMFLTATTEAAQNDNYNGTNASFYDAVRGPYLTDGGRDIYDISDVEEDFSIALPEFKHFLLIICGLIMLVEFFEMAINAVARMFNMLLLYIISPPFIAVSPFDDGSRFRQWCTAFIIQTFSVFGSVISIRLFLIIVPIVMQSELEIFSDGVMNMLAKLALIIAAGYTAHKASGLVGGIVGENAAQQAIFAGDVASSMEQGMPGRLAGMAASGAGDIVAGTVGGAWRGGKGLVKSGAGAISSLKQNYTTGKLRQNLDKELGGGGNSNPASRSEAARDFLNLNPEMAKKAYGLTDAGYAQRHDAAQRIFGQYTQGIQSNQAASLRDGLQGPNGQDVARNFLNMDREQAKSMYGFSDAQYDTEKARAENGLNYGAQRKEFLDKVNSGGAEGIQAAKDFLAKSPEEGMRSLGLDNEQYRSLSSDLNRFVSGDGGGSGNGAGNSNPQANSANSNNSNNNNNNNNSGGGAGGVGGGPASGFSAKQPPTIRSRRGGSMRISPSNYNMLNQNSQLGNDPSQNARQRRVSNGNPSQAGSLEGTAVNAVASGQMQNRNQGNIPHAGSVNIPPVNSNLAGQPQNPVMGQAGQPQNRNPGSVVNSASQNIVGEIPPVNSNSSSAAGGVSNDPGYAAGSQDNAVSGSSDIVNHMFDANPQQNDTVSMPGPAEPINILGNVGYVPPGTTDPYSRSGGQSDSGYTGNVQQTSGVSRGTYSNYSNPQQMAQATNAQPTSSASQGIGSYGSQPQGVQAGSYNSNVQPQSNMYNVTGSQSSVNRQPMGQPNVQPTSSASQSISNYGSQPRVQTGNYNSNVQPQSNMYTGAGGQGSVNPQPIGQPNVQPTSSVSQGISNYGSQPRVQTGSYNNVQPQPNMYTSAGSQGPVSSQPGVQPSNTQPISNVSGGTYSNYSSQPQASAADSSYVQLQPGTDYATSSQSYAAGNNPVYSQPAVNSGGFGNNSYGSANSTGPRISILGDIGRYGYPSANTQPSQPTIPNIQNASVQPGYQSSFARNDNVSSGNTGSVSANPVYTVPNITQQPAANQPNVQQESVQQPVNLQSGPANLRYQQENPGSTRQTRSTVVRNARANSVVQSRSSINNRRALNSNKKK